MRTVRQATSWTATSALVLIVSSTMAASTPRRAAATVPPAVGSAPLVRPNIILIVTDDQTMESVAKMPYLSAQPDLISFGNAFIENALCCPSRAAILTGQYDSHNGVGTNVQGANLDEAETLPVWLQRAGYSTGLSGKYLNLYNGSYMPPGWNDWNVPYFDNGQGYYDQYTYTLNANGVTEGHDTYAATDYLGNVIAKKAVAFIQSSAAGTSPFFLLFAPTQTHGPWVASPKRAGMFKGVPVPLSPNVNEADMSDKPAWINQRPLVSIATQNAHRRKEWAAAVSVDDEIVRLDNALRATGRYNSTVLILMTDNGFSFGEHRWTNKRCEYEECSHTPLLIRYPGQAGGADRHLVSNIDLASTISDIAGAAPTIPQDGQSLAPVLLGRGSPHSRTEMLLHWSGGDGGGMCCNSGVIPQFWGVRTDTAKYVELDTGEREFYNLAADPYELTNVYCDPAVQVCDPAQVARQADLSARLDALKTQAGAAGLPRRAWLPIPGPLPPVDTDR